MVNAKEHLTKTTKTSFGGSGIHKIVSNKARAASEYHGARSSPSASINRGLTDELKVAFPNTIPALKSLAVNTEIPHPY